MIPASYRLTESSVNADTDPSAQIYSSDSPSNTTGPAVNATLYTPPGSTSAAPSFIASNWLLPFIIALLLHSFFASW